MGSSVRRVQQVKLSKEKAVVQWVCPHLVEAGLGLEPRELAYIQ